MILTDITQKLEYQKKYLIENNYEPICGINLYCCELNFYKNRIYYLQHFICYFYKS